jgi:hypothetical protein
VDNRAPDEEITLKVREPFSRHTLAGINLFVIKMFSHSQFLFRHFPNNTASFQK